MNRNEELRKTSGEVYYSSQLTCFLYTLMRDYLPVGEVEACLQDALSTCGNKTEYSNGYLDQYADNIAYKLTKYGQSDMCEKETLSE